MQSRQECTQPLPSIHFMGRKDTSAAGGQGPRLHPTCPVAACQCTRGSRVVSSHDISIAAVGLLQKNKQQHCCAQHGITTDDCLAFLCGPLHATGWSMPCEAVPNRSVLHASLDAWLQAVGRIMLADVSMCLPPSCQADSVHPSSYDLSGTSIT